MLRVYRKLFQVILIVLMIGSLHAQSKPEVIKIDPKSKTSGILGLSDLVESVEYVPLETTAKCLVGILPREFDVSKNYIVLNCWKTNQIYLFRRNGSFVCLVGGGGSEKGIPNDFDGGPSVWPVVQKEDIWYAFQDASSLCGDEVQPNKLKPKGPATAVQALKKLSKKLEPDDNPVLMILKRKAMK